MGYVCVGTDWAVEFDPQSIFNRVLVLALATNHSMKNYGYVALRSFHRRTIFPQTFRKLGRSRSKPTTNEEFALGFGHREL